MGEEVASGQRQCLAAGAILRRPEYEQAAFFSGHWQLTISRCLTSRCFLGDNDRECST